MLGAQALTLTGLAGLAFMGHAQPTETAADSRPVIKVFADRNCPDGEANEHEHIPTVSTYNVSTWQSFQASSNASAYKSVSVLDNWSCWFLYKQEDRMVTPILHPSGGISNWPASGRNASYLIAELEAPQAPAKRDDEAAEPEYRCWNAAHEGQAPIVDLCPSSGGGFYCSPPPSA